MPEAPRYQSSELSRKGLLAGAATLLATLVLAVAPSLGFVWAWWPGPIVRVEHAGRAGQLETPAAFVGSRLDPALASTRAQVEAQWQARAHSYARIPGEAAARIPVERAIELICAGVEVGP